MFITSIITCVNMTHTICIIDECKLPNLCNGSSHVGYYSLVLDLLICCTVKPVLSGRSKRKKRRQKLVFKTYYRLMQVKSIAQFCLYTFESHLNRNQFSMQYWCPFCHWLLNVLHFYLLVLKTLCYLLVLFNSHDFC